jgi:hypothetical protein
MQLMNKRELVNQSEKREMQIIEKTQALPVYWYKRS